MMAELFRIKICGITHSDDARAAVGAGADAIGLNFCRQSPRFIDDAVAKEIVQACPVGVQKVGVFVNEPVDEIHRRVVRLQLDIVQLHGDEPPGLLAALARCAVIRAFRCRSHSLEEVAKYLFRCRQRHCEPRAVLLDAWNPNRYGGTGAKLDWHRLRSELPRLEGTPWILAGGLRPENVAEAIRQLQPDAVDVASGVESAPGRKDPDAVARFVRAARSAYP